VDAARSFLRANAALFRQTESSVDALELVSDSPLAFGGGHAVIFRQRFGDLPATEDGLVTVGVSGGRVAYVSSSLTGGTELSGDDSLSAVDAWLAAAGDVGLEVAAGDIANVRDEGGWTTFDTGLSQPGRARLVALPTADGARQAYEAVVIDVDAAGEPTGARTFVDAETGEVLARRNLVDQAADNPRWKYFRATPPLDLSGTDTRAIGCHASVAGCGIVHGRSTENTSATEPWDHSYSNGQPSFTTTGNNADTALSAASPLTPGPDRAFRPSSPTREYLSPFTNSWQAADCNPAVFTGAPPATGPDVFGGTDANDVNAAIINLFAGHNRMHDWSYHLGFTERNFNMQVDNLGRGGRPGDPELGDAQAGALTGGSPTYTGRDNANQITPNDGIPPITNMYLWQPVAGAFYPPCVDGDFDMTVIGHEYTHAISNRMVAGPDSGLSSGSDGQARSMGESFSDLTAVELLQEYGYTPVGGENPFAVGPYVTGNFQKGIRNYAMNRSPLNYSDVQGYDGSGQGSPHDDGEIWSAVNYDIRQALVRKYQDSFSPSNASLQRRCADGVVPPGRCPGNRRWMQLVFDSYLLMPSRTSMLDARDAMLAADRMRFNGVNTDLLWRTFAHRGFGVDASSNGTDDPQPEAGFKDPRQDNEATVRLRPQHQGGEPTAARLYVGDYQAKVTPIADRDPDTRRDGVAQFVPGTYDFLVYSRGDGMSRFSVTLQPGETRDLTIRLAPNWASRYRGATVSGDGENLKALISDSENRNWASLGEPVRGTRVAVNLAGDQPRLVRRVQVSSLLRTRATLPTGDPDPRDPSQNRFSALRRFRIEACDASGPGTCTPQDDYDPIYTSPPNAFPAGVPRPLSPDLILREFNVQDTEATHVRLVVLTNQCTGTPAYQGEQDADPTNSTDCSEDSAQAENVRANELQVFTGRTTVGR
jgi:hypothetical protein